MGYDPEEKTYKVVMMVNEYSRNWVFTLGTDKSWREIKSDIKFVVTTNDAVCASGVIYMLGSCREGNPFIVAFDVKNENFRVITLWNSSDHSGYCYLKNLNGKLAILYIKNLSCGDYMDLWILGNETRKEEWENRIVKIPQQSTTFCSSSDGDILFTKRFNSRQLICFCYDVTKKSWRNFEIEGLPEQNLINGIYSYVESLFPVEK